MTDPAFLTCTAYLTTGRDHSTRSRLNSSIESPFGPSSRAVAKAPFPTEATVKSHLVRIYYY
jgi:hypothetical protein